MADYRAYQLGADGHIACRIDLECENDQHAVTAAQQHVDGCDVELWQGVRLVATLSGRDRSR